MVCWMDLITDMVECVLINAPLPWSGHSVSHSSFDLRHCTLQCFVAIARNACINVCTPHTPSSFAHRTLAVSLSPSVSLSISVFHTHTHTHTHTTHTYIFLFWSNAAHLPSSLNNLVGFAKGKIILNLRIVVPNKGTVTFLVVRVSWHLALPWPSGYSIKVAMKEVDSMLYPLPSVQLKAKYTGNNWRNILPHVLMG